jgi:lysophospholipase L1-like esterase
VPAEGRWPVRLANALRKEGVALADPRIIATTGWTTDELEWGIDSAEPLGTFDFVTLLIGVNNQYRNRSAVGYGGEFHTLLQRAIRHAGGRPERVMVLSIPDWGVTPFARSTTSATRATIAGAFDDFNAARRRCCEADGVAYVDISPSLARELGGDAAGRPTVCILRTGCTRCGRSRRCRSSGRWLTR